MLAPRARPRIDFRHHGRMKRPHTEPTASLSPTPSPAPARPRASTQELDAAELARVIGGTANTANTGNKVWQDDWLAPV
jgi:hypothetical protein